jgi:putative copper export protein
MPPVHDIVAMILRAASFIACIQAAGIFVFLFLLGAHIANSTRQIRSLGQYSAIAGLALTLAHYLVEPARMVGSMTGVFDPIMHTMLLDTNIAAAAATRILGLALLTIGLRTSSRMNTGTSVMGTALLIISFSLVGHTVVHDLRWLLVALLVCHLIVVAFWFGSLLPLISVSKRENLDVTSAVIERFSKIATWTVPLIFLVGLGMSVALLGHWENLWTPYGNLLLAKVAAFAVLMGLATMNKWRFGPAIARASDTALIGFRRTVAAEWYLIAAILAATAVMTGLFSPTD